MLRERTGYQSDSGIGVGGLRSTSRSSNMTSVRKNGEPYRATRLWLKAVAIFRQGVPLGKHRRQWKTYDNCFVASEAVTWFHIELQQTFHSDNATTSTQQSENKRIKGISRQQTHQLLQKFYKAGIFVPVSNTSNTSISMNNSAIYSTMVGFNKETDFKDNGQLYRLTVDEEAIDDYEIIAKPRSLNNSSKKQTPNQNDNQNLPNVGNYSIVIKPLSLGEINAVWEEHFIFRLKSIVGSDVTRILYNQPHLVPGHWIAHNMTQIGKYGIVKSSKHDDLPKWLIQAMKCLANWPNHTNDQPNYPGFENDVFKLVVDYFNKYCFNGTGPLLSFGLYDAFITSFIQAELLDFNTRLYSAKNANNTKTAFQKVPTPMVDGGIGIHSRQFKRWASIPSSKFNDEQYPFNASESVENLLFDILTPQTKSLRQRKFGIGQPKRIFPETHLNSSINESIPEPMPVKPYNISRYTSSIANSTNPSCYYYETAFTGNVSPLTRVISKTELQSSFGNSLPLQNPACSFSKSNLTGIGPSFDQTYAYENPTLDLSGRELIYHPKYSKLVNSSIGLLATNSSELSSELNSTSYSFCQYSNGNSWETSKVQAPDQTKLEVRSPTPSFPAARIMNSSLNNGTRLYGKTRSFSAIDLSDSYRDRNPFVTNRNASSFDFDFDDLSTGKQDTARRTLDFYYGRDACVPGLVTKEGKQLAIQSFRLLTLLLTPTNRRHLQLLLRCMAKMARNDKLMLDVAMTTRALVVDTFFKIILCSSDDAEFDELLALRIVTFMMDNDSEIFCLQNETEMVESTLQKISEKQITKVPNTPESKKVEESIPKVVDQQNTPLNRLTPKLFSRNTPKSASKENSKNNTPKSKADKKLQNENKGDENEKENKENQVKPAAAAQYCGLISLNEYESQKFLGVTAPSLRQLLNAILTNSRMTKKEKKERLERFVDEYPHIYTEKFGDSPLEEILSSCSEEINGSINNSSSIEKSVDKTKQVKKSNPFNRLFKNFRL